MSIRWLTTLRKKHLENHIELRSGVFVGLSLHRSFQNMDLNKSSINDGENTLSKLFDDFNKMNEVPEPLEVSVNALSAFMLNQMQINRYPREENDKRIRTFQYFTQKDSSQKTPLHRFAEPFVKYLGCKSRDLMKIELQQVLNLCAKLAFDQHDENPEHFVSHGFNHSLNVTEYLEQIINSNMRYDTQNNKMTILAYIAKQYAISENSARFIILLIGLLHDCGYPKLDGKAKANHSIYGADLIDDLKLNLLKLIDKAAQNTKELADKLFTDFRAAIFFHNADVKEKESFNYRIITNKGEFLCNAAVLKTIEEVFENRFPNRTILEKINDNNHLGRTLDLVTPDDKHIGLPFHAANITDNPFALFIRLADNMDMSIRRFSPLQREQVFMKIYQELAKKRSLNEILQECQKDLDLSPFGKEIAKVAKKLNAKSERFYGSCECIEYVEFVERILKPATSKTTSSDLDKSCPHLENESGYRKLPNVNSTSSDDVKDQDDIPCLNVYVNTRRYEELLKITFEEEDIGILAVGSYQLWRAEQAFKSLNYNKIQDPTQVRRIEVKVIKI